MAGKPMAGNQQHRFRFRRTPAVLVVDDEPMARWLLSDELRDAGFDVVEAGHAAEALRVLKAGVGIDLVLCDLRMPGNKQGSDLIKAVRAEFAHLPVIVCSGNLALLDPDDQVDGVIEKPFLPGTVVAQARRVLKPDEPSLERPAAARAAPV